LLAVYIVCLDPDPEQGLVTVHHGPDDRAAVQPLGRVGDVSHQPVGGGLRHGRTGDRSGSPDGQRHRAAVGQRTQAGHEPVVGEGGRVNAVCEIAQVGERRADDPPRRTVGFGLLLGRIVGG
jgi:hypothetical protein